ncbi:MAG TPA: NAD(P)-dependent oxidoreductase [Terriglobia bacterium]
MRILITGGLGAIGPSLVDELRQRGHDVWLCDLGHHHDPQYLRCDVAEYRQLERIFEHQRFDLVYHLAAEFGRWNGEDFYETLWRSNVIGTKNLLRLQEKHGFRQVFFSTSEVYGDWNGIMREDVMELHEIRQLNDYAMTKWVGEMQVLNSAAMAGTESVRVRLFNVYGPGEKYSSYRSMNCRFCYSALHGLPYTVYLNHHRSSTYVADAVSTLANITNNFIPGEVYNIGSTEYHDIKTVSDLVLGAVGRDDRLVAYKPSEPFTTRDKKIDVGKAERDLGHRPRVSLAEGLARTLAWMRDYYAVREPAPIAAAALPREVPRIPVKPSGRRTACNAAKGPLRIPDTRSLVAAEPSTSTNR